MAKSPRAATLRSLTHEDSMPRPNEEARERIRKAISWWKSLTPEQRAVRRMAIEFESMADALREAIRRRDAMPVKERVADMVKRGVIDAEGNVLLRMPVPPSDESDEDKE